MKMKAAQKVHYEAGPNMTPLVDIVMVILIFLMLTGTFAAGQHFLQSNIPLTNKGIGVAPEKKSSLPEDTELRIRTDSFTRPGADGLSQDVWAAQAGRVMVQSNHDQLVAQLSKMRDELNKADTPTDKIQVVIDPGRQTKYKHLVEVYSAALDAKFTKIAFAPAH